MKRLKNQNRHKLISFKFLSLALVLLLTFTPLSVFGRTPIISLKSPTPQIYSTFGHTMTTGDFDGDGKYEIIVSSEQERVGDNHNQGKVYIFDEGGKYLFALNSPNPQIDGYFGSSLSSGDLDGDGRWEVLVGARGENMKEASGVGRAYLFDGKGYLLHSFANPNYKEYSSFGYSVLMKDLDGNGRAEIIIGAPTENTTLTTAIPVGSSKTGKTHGRVYIFSGTDFSLMDILAPTDLNKNINLGSSLASGDIDGDGIKELIAGAIGGETGGFSSQGEVYIFGRKGEGGEKKWSLLNIITTPNPGPMSLFGYALATGDINGDGKADIAIGAPGEMVGKSFGQGKVYIYDGAKKIFTHSLTTPDVSANAYFGSSIILIDINGDKGDDFIIGAFQKSKKDITNQGFVFAYSGKTTALFYSLTTAVPQQDSFFGTSLVFIPSKNRMGKLAVGAPGEKDLEGRVYIFNPEYKIPIWGYLVIIIFLALMGIYTTILIRRFIRAKMIYLHLMEKRKEKLQSKEKPVNNDHTSNT